MKKLLFISCHRIGVRLPKSFETPLTHVTVIEQSPELDYVEEVGRRLTEFDLVIAYAPVNGFVDFARLVADHRHRLAIVTCDCQKQEKVKLLEKAGLDQSYAEWTESCGGQMMLGDLASTLRSTDELRVGRLLPVS